MSNIAPEVYKQIFKDLQTPGQAAIAQQKAGILQETRTITIALDTAQLSTAPMRLTFPFRSFYVQDATDSNVSVSVKLATDDSFQDAFSVKKNQGYELPYPTTGVSLYWSAQASKTMTIIFSTSGIFKSNITTSTLSGQVQLGDGTSVASQTGAQVTSSAASIFSSDSTRIMMEIQNQDTIPIWISGDSAVTTDTGTKPGIRINPGESYEWRSTAACYAIAKASTGANTVSLVKFS